MHAALFVSEDVHERWITLGDGSSHKLYFREIPSAEFRKLQTTGRTDDQQEAAVSSVIAASLVSPKEGGGWEPAMDAAQATNLKPGIRVALSIAIAEVNGIGANVGKALPPEGKNGSGTS